MTDPIVPNQKTTKFVSELTYLINSQSIENGSDTPDFILAEYLIDCLVGYEKAIAARNEWFTRVDDERFPQG